MGFPRLLLGAYAVVAVLIIVLARPQIAEEIFPSAASTQFRLRIDAPDGTRVAVTEALVEGVWQRLRERQAPTISISAWAMSGHKLPPTRSIRCFCGPADRSRPSSTSV